MRTVKRTIDILAMALILGLAALRAKAESSQHHGSISVTFHDGNKNRDSSDRYYVSKEGGLTHWRNYQEDRDDGHKSGVYEIKSTPVLSQRIPSRHTPSEQARIAGRASAPSANR